MSIIALTGSKGGSGKSTCATALASEFVRRGRTCLLVDLDPQQTSLSWRAMAEEGAAGPTVVAMNAGFSEQLDNLASGYDYVIIDPPGRDGSILRESLMVADVAIIPCQPTPADLWAVADTVDTVRRARGLRPELTATVLLSRVDARTTYSKTVVGELAKLGLSVFGTQIAQRSAYQQAMAIGSGPTIFAPGSKADGEIRGLADELEGQLRMRVAPLSHVSFSEQQGVEVA